ncbi:hypothetical protein Ppa06_39160 [Planomonospora parontospora subsp. parontospora]|uniref:ABC1 atypical kinase-like domain-containing protein n=2 Tax=Planomonospora parontospora TaxID=58119 RepID=A0AA37BJ48_9ACTN|nr:AarF/ABC1/UbiB kinase family protein [Planomonospora parontospora]GGK76563.1 hypothetical protein GCM10010126_39750 [Planomonospora parontospora]GII10118.1 hypothetical protein Ppa06_39160 [Planomonospora parontospora subsp. parontospora]
MQSRPSPWLLCRRTLHLIVHGFRTLSRLLLIAAVSPREHRGERLAAEAARLPERLGGAFLKAGQLLATRVDLVGEQMAEALGRLHDRVEPMSSSQALRAAQSAFDELPLGFRRALTRPPVASGSIACVYRVDLDGGPAAIKVRRPDIARTFAADIAMFRFMARIAERVPALRRVPLADIAGQMGDCLIGQLDFSREAVNLRRLRSVLAEVPGTVVPEPYAAACADGVVTMEFIDGLDRSLIGRLPSEAREAGVAALVRAVYHMLFVEGFIHVDLHQGNVYFRRDGKVVILDAGFVFRMSDMARTSFTRFFAGMIQGDGESCAEILLSTVRRVEKNADVGRFRSDVAGLVVRNAGALARDFDLAAFAVQLFELQRRHRLFAEPEFVFPLLCLLSLEGTVRRFHPAMDFQLEAAPYVMQGLLTDALEAST